MHIAGGADDTLAALRARPRAHAGDARAASAARWAASSSPAPSPTRSSDGVKGPGFPVEVYNVLGAGDAFMSGFLRGWLRDEPLETCCAYANACGAFAVSRLLCSPEYPDLGGAQHFLEHGSRASGAAPRRGAQPHPLGDDAPAAAGDA